MTTLAYCAVSPDGCGTPNELILTPETVPGLAKLADAVHAEGAAVSARRRVRQACSCLHLSARG